MLKPIIGQFVAAFEGTGDLDFLGHIVSKQYNGSGSTEIGGWITAFCVFSDAGVFRSGEGRSAKNRAAKANGTKPKKILS